MNFIESIAVLGPDDAGKGLILKQFEPKVPKQWPPHIPEPLRYKLRSDEYPELARYVLSNYSKVSELQLDLHEHNGLIILSFIHVHEFSKPDALQQYYYFFEFLRKLVWLGVDRYVLAITHMDLIPETTAAWFDETASWLKRSFEAIFELKIEKCVPTAMRNDGSIDNLFDRKTGGFLSWDKGPTLIEALNAMISKEKKTHENLWLLGKIDYMGKKREPCLKTVHCARGEIRGNEKVKIFPYGTECFFSSDTEGNHLVNPTKVWKYSNSQRSGPLLLVSSDTNAKERSVMEVHAVLKSKISSFDIQEENRSFSFTFFGPQSKEGEIDRSTPYRISSVSAELSLPKALNTNKQEAIRQFLGKEALLRIFCRRTGAVVDLYRKDKDAGRVLIWDDRTEKYPVLVGAGRIIGFPDIEIQDFVEKLLLFDQFRVCENHQSEILSYTLERIYHGSKLFMDNTTVKHDLNYLKTNKKSLEEDFQKILNETIFIQDKIKENKLPKQLRNLHPHLVRAQKNLSKRYEKVINLFANRTSLKIIEQMTNDLRDEYARNTEFIRKQTIFPFRACVLEAKRKLPEKMKNRVKINNYMPTDWSYYLQDPTVLDLILEAICQLFDNSRYYAGRNNNIRIDVFIHPPTVQSHDYVRIQYQDNGPLSDEVLKKIENSESGIFVIKQKLSFKGVRLNFPEHKGVGTSFSLNIPVWNQRLNKLENFSTDLIEIFNAIDFSSLKNKTVFQNFLGRFEKILVDWPTSSLLTKLQNLWSDAEKVSGSYKQWFDYNQAFFFSLLEPKSGSQLQKIIRFIHYLRNKPIIYAVQEAVAKAKVAFPNHIVRIKRSTKSLPPHRIEMLSMYHSLRDAIAWGLCDFILPNIPYGKNPCLSFDFQISQSNKCDYILIILTGKNFTRISDMLLPLRTRFLNLDINAFFTTDVQDECILRIPVYITNVKEE